MDRRAFLTASAVAATSTALKTTASAETTGSRGRTSDPVRIPDAHVESLDDRFKGPVGEGSVERVATGFGWAEGPAYFAAGRYLIFSDVLNNRMMRLLEDDNHLSVFRQPSLKANGNTVDRQGRLYTCEQAGRRVTRTEYDGANTVIADRYNGKLNAPNDIVVASNGSVWFTDPTYGLVDMMEQEKTNVLRVDGKSGARLPVDYGGSSDRDPEARGNLGRRRCRLQPACQRGRGSLSRLRGAAQRSDRSRHRRAALPDG